MILGPPGLPEPLAPSPSNTNPIPSTSPLATVISRHFILDIISVRSNEKEEPWHDIMDWVTVEQQRRWSHKLGSYLLDLLNRDIAPGEHLHVLEDLKLEIKALDTVIQTSFKNYFRDNVGIRKDLSQLNYKARQGNLLYLGHRFKSSLRILEKIIKRLRRRSNPSNSFSNRDLVELKDTIKSLHKFFDFCKMAEDKV